MTMKQYERLQEAKKAGDEDLAKQILGEEYGEDSTIIDVVVEPVFSDEDIASDIGAGLSNAEIAEKYGITVQKVAAVKRKSK